MRLPGLLWLSLACLAGTAGLGACSGTSGSTAGPDDGGSQRGNEAAAPDAERAQSLRTEEENGACPSSPVELRGSSPAGAACSSYADCKPTCCACDGAGPLAA